MHFWFGSWWSSISKGVRDRPGNLQSATSNVHSGKAIIYFGLLLAIGVFFVFIAFTMFLPVMVLMPQKFAICFTLGSGFIIGSFFAIRGPKKQFAHMSLKERLPFTLGFSEVWLVPYLFPWFFTATFFLCSFPRYRFLHLPTMLFLTSLVDLLG